MPQNPTPNAFRAFLHREWRQIIVINKSDRPWQMPAAAALAIGLPLLVGCGFGHMDYGLISSLGGMVFLNLPETPLHHRMVQLIACAFAMSASYALGALSHLFPPAMMVVLTFVAILVTMLCRFYRVGPPGGLFFTMAAAVAAYSPCEVLEIPRRVGLITLGCLLAALIAFFYSLVILRRRPAAPIEPLPPATFDFVVFDSVVIGCFVGVALLLAQFLQLEKAYWVPVSCLVVMQGMSLRAIWEKQLHRILGTGIGLLTAWGLLMLPFNNWSLSFTMMAIAFIVETTVVRHYGFAMVFITPLTILLADAATLDPNAVGTLVEARFFDTVLGCLTGFAGGTCLHSPRFRAAMGSRLRRLLQAGRWEPSRQTPTRN
ncbi:MAG: FUSC family protein [Azoarcus sp.]|nr:FUSC family protein [Azoarcus sp.]